MRFRVTRTHERGIPLSRREIVRSTGTLGELVTAQTEDESYKGTLIVARLHEAAGAPLAELLPSLYQVTLRVLAPQGMLLTGHERIRDRDRVVTEYVQGWWARLP